MIDTLHVSALLTHVPHTDTIILGYVIGHAELPHGRKMDVIGSGKTLRFTIDGIDGYVDLDLNPIAKQAAILLTGGE